MTNGFVDSGEILPFTVAVVQLDGRRARCFSI